MEVVSVIGGTGTMGMGISKRLLDAGYQTIIGSRNPEKSRAVLKEKHSRDFDVLTNEEAVRSAGIIFLTVPYSNHSNILNQLKPLMKGKILIDTTVSFNKINLSLSKSIHYVSAACEAQEILGEDVKVIAALQTISAHLLKEKNGIEGHVFVTSDDKEAANRIVKLLDDIRLKALYAGPLHFSAAVERMTPLLVQVNKINGFKTAGLCLSDCSLKNEEKDKLTLIPVKGIPLIKQGDDLPNIILNAIHKNGLELEDGDILVIAQKIISKFEGRCVTLANVEVSEEAKKIAFEVDKEEQLVQLILEESKEVVRMKRGLLIVEHRLGHVMANAGIDQSNIDNGQVLLLPKDPDASAKHIRESMYELYGKRIAVVISDSFGRPWRKGVVGVALGIAGLQPLIDKRGETDLFGKKLNITEVGVADSIASMAVLRMGEASEGIPVVLLKGYKAESDHVGINPLLREKKEDLFR